MVFELVKNSLRAVQERHMDSDRIAPPVRIIVAEGIEDVTIKVLLSCIIPSMKMSTFNRIPSVSVCFNPASHLVLYVLCNSPKCFFKLVSLM